MGFGKILRELRLEKCLTQKQLGAMISTTSDCIHYWEVGKSEPSIAQILQLAEVFEVSTDYLLGKTEY